MAYTNTIVKAENLSLTAKELVPTLVAESPFLTYQAGVQQDVARGLSVQIAQAALTSQAYTGADLTVNDATDTGAIITVNQGQGWAERVLKADQDRSAVADLASKYGALGVRTIASDIDTVIAAAGAATTTSVTGAAVTSANVEATLAGIVEELLDNNANINDCHIYVPSYVYTALEIAQGRVTQSNESAFRAGIALPFMGAMVHLSNNLVDTTGTKTMIGCTTWGLQYAIGSMASEIVPNGSGNFGLVSQGYAVFGAKVIDVAAVVKCDVTKG